MAQRHSTDFSETATSDGAAREVYEVGSSERTPDRRVAVMSMPLGILERPDFGQGGRAVGETVLNKPHNSPKVNTVYIGNCSGCVCRRGDSQAKLCLPASRIITVLV